MQGAIARKVRPVGATLIAMTAMTAMTLPGTAHAYTPRMGAAAAATATATATSQGTAYVVMGKEVGARVAAAVVAVERCERANGTAASTLVSGDPACDSLRRAEHQAERALVVRGRGALDASEPAATDATYGKVSVTVIPQADGNSSMVITPVSVADAAMSQAGATSSHLAPLSRLLATAPHVRPHGRVRDGIPVQWYSCDSPQANPSWCYAHASIVYSPSGQGWNLNFDFDFKKPGSPSTPQQIWGSNWRVNGGSVCCNQSWSGQAYSNSSNGSHGEEWPIAYGTVTFSAGGANTSHSVKIMCDISWNLQPMSWNGSYIQ